MLAARAVRVLEAIYRHGDACSKVKVLLMDLRQRGGFRGAAAPTRETRGTVRVGRISADAEYSMKREIMSQRYTTRWDDHAI